MGPEVTPASASRSSDDQRLTTRRAEDRRLLRRDRELEAARRVSEALFQHLRLDELIEKALGIALEVVEAENGSILIADPESRQLVFRHSIGASPVQVGTSIPWEKGIAGAVFHTGEPVIIGDAAKDQRYFSDIDVLTEHVTRDMIALPLKRWEGQPIGVMEILNKRHGTLGEEDLTLLCVVSAIAAASIEQARLYHEAKLAEVVRLLGDISHDIKNLLMPVATGAGLLEGEIKDLYDSLGEKDQSKAEASYGMCKEVIGMFGTSTRRIQDRVKEIADCVKGLSTEPAFAPCRVATVMKGVCEALRWVADQNKITLNVEGLEPLPQIEADERRLFNAFYNLINNAIPEVSAGGSVTVYGKEDPPGVGILVSVTDTGRGMPPEIRDSLFTARAKSRKAGGTGLGTKIVKDVVESHRGRISVDSQLGTGTTFYIYLPLCQTGS